MGDSLTADPSPTALFLIPAGAFGAYLSQLNEGTNLNGKHVTKTDENSHEDYIYSTAERVKADQIERV